MNKPGEIQITLQRTSRLKTDLKSLSTSLLAASSTNCHGCTGPRDKVDLKNQNIHKKANITMYLNKKKQSGSFFNKLHCTERQSGNLKKSYRIILQKSCIIVNFVHSRVRNKHSPTLINFLTFFQGLWPYSGLHQAYSSSIQSCA